MIKPFSSHQSLACFECLSTSATSTVVVAAATWCDILKVLTPLGRVLFKDNNLKINICFSNKIKLNKIKYRSIITGITYEFVVIHFCREFTEYVLRVQMSKYLGNLVILCAMLSLE